MDNARSAGCQSGVPEGLLHILGLDCLKSAEKWTLIQTRRRYFLNIVVSRRQPFKFGAKTKGQPCGPEAKTGDVGTGTTPPNTHNRDPGLSENGSDSKAGGNFQSEKNRIPIHSDHCRTSTDTKKKRKSPSTTKRNRERWDRWQARRWKVGALLNRTEPSNQNPHSGDPVPNNNNNNSSRPAPEDLESTTSPCAVRQNPPSPSDLDAEGSINLPEQPSDIQSNDIQSSDIQSGVSSVVKEYTPDSPQPVKAYTPDSPDKVEDFTPNSPAVVENQTPDTLASPEIYCAYCRFPDSDLPGALKKCTRCLSVYYCGRTCQAKDWQQHRLVCGVKHNPTHF